MGLYICHELWQFPSFQNVNYIPIGLGIIYLEKMDVKKTDLELIKELNILLVHN